LHCAIQSSKAPNKRKEVILLLLSKGKANASLGDSYGSIPYDYCDDDEEDTDLKELLQPIVPPIFKALLDQNEEQLESILKEQPSATETRHLSKTPLMVVVEQLLLLDDDDDDDEDDDESLVPADSDTEGQQDDDSSYVIQSAPNTANTLATTRSIDDFVLVDTQERIGKNNVNANQ